MIVADNSGTPVEVTINHLKDILHSLPVDVIINRIYIADSNKEITINYTVDDKKYALRVNQGRYSVLHSRWGIMNQALDGDISQSLMNKMAL